MNLEQYLVFGTTEIANSLRTLTYLWRGLGGPGFVPSTTTPTGSGGGFSDIYSDIYTGDAGFNPGDLACYCATMDPGTGFRNPAYDAAPWYDAARPESEDFLGLIADITLLPAAKRNLTRRSQGGGDVGQLVVGPRIMQVKATAFAGSRAGMGYGEAWLRRVLAGSGEGCGGDTMTVLPYCTAEGEDDGSGSLREMVAVGLIDAPVFSAVTERSGCRMQSVSFQFAAGSGYLRKTTELFTGALGTTETCETMTAPMVADAAPIITIDAGPGVLSGVEITGSRGACPIVGSPDAAYTVVDLPGNSHLVIDASRETVTVTDVNGDVIGGMNYLNFAGVFVWMRSLAGTQFCVCVDSTTATGTAGATLTIEQVDLEL